MDKNRKLVKSFEPKYIPYRPDDLFDYDLDRIKEYAFELGNYRQQHNWLLYVRMEFKIEFASEESKKDPLYIQKINENFLIKLNRLIKRKRNLVNKK